MKYVFEKGISLPVCAVLNDIYFNPLSGDVLSVEQEHFVKQKLIDKKMKIQDCNIKIYRVIDIENDRLIAYNYQINGISNFLQLGFETPFNENIKQFIKDKINSGEYIQKIRWGDEYE